MLIMMLCWSPAAQITGVIHPREQHKHAAQTTGITHPQQQHKEDQHLEGSYAGPHWTGRLNPIRMKLDCCLSRTYSNALPSSVGWGLVKASDGNTEGAQLYTAYRNTSACASGTKSD